MCATLRRKARPDGEAWGPKIWLPVSFGLRSLDPSESSVASARSVTRATIHCPHSKVDAYDDERKRRIREPALMNLSASSKDLIQAHPFVVFTGQADLVPSSCSGLPSRKAVQASDRCMICGT